MPTQTVRQHKQPAVAACLLRRVGFGVTDEVFVVSAHLSGIGKLGKLKFEHGCSRTGLAARIAPGGAERHPSMPLWHVYDPKGDGTGPPLYTNCCLCGSRPAPHPRGS